MFRLGVARQDDRDDITAGIAALAAKNVNGAVYLRMVLERLEDADVTTLGHEERIALYVAGKVVGG